MEELTEDRRSGLRQAKLKALVSGVTAGEVQTFAFPHGAALIDANSAGWILLEDTDRVRVGAALSWASRRNLAALHLITSAPEVPAGVAARQARLATLPTSVQRLSGTSLVDVEPWPWAPLPPEDSQILENPRVAQLVDSLTSAGLEIVVEHGIVRGEVLGLECARIVPTDAGSWSLEVGVGRLDREMSAMMFAHLPPAESVLKAAEYVRRWRYRGATRHPLRDLVLDRWLRAELCADPESVGAKHLRPLECSVEPTNLRELQSSAAGGADLAGRPLIVVCSAGNDLEAAVVAAETRAWRSPDARLVLVVPERSSVAVLELANQQLRSPAEIVTVANPF